MNNKIKVGDVWIDALGFNISIIHKHRYQVDRLGYCYVGLREHICIPNKIILGQYTEDGKCIYDGYNLIKKIENIGDQAINLEELSKSITNVSNTFAKLNDGINERLDKIENKLGLNKPIELKVGDVYKTRNGLKAIVVYESYEKESFGVCIPAEKDNPYIYNCSGILICPIVYKENKDDYQLVEYLGKLGECE